MKVKTFLFILCAFFFSIVNSQTVPVTIYLDAHHSPYEEVILYGGGELLDADGDRVFEITQDLEHGFYDYGYWVNNSLGGDPENPLQRNGNAFSTLEVSDPMITYLLPKDGGMMKKNRIRANLAFTAANPPLTGTMNLTINGTAVSNPDSYYNAATRTMLLENPPSLIDGANTMTFSYSTNAGQIERSSTFTYHPIILDRDPRTYRMENILVWGRVMETPYPASVGLECGSDRYTVSVNAEGYFGTEVSIVDGKNEVKVAYTEAGLSNPLDEMSIQAELRHSWWVELTASLNDDNGTVAAEARGIDASELSFLWAESVDNPESLGISGSSTSVSFAQPSTAGEYQMLVQVSAADGTSYTARKIFLQDEDPHFLGIHERAPWMEEAVAYETEDDYFNWGNYSFAKMKTVLPHMKKVGMNTLLLPPFNVGGYISADHFEQTTAYGTEEDLIDLVATAHEFGIRVMFDIALGHSNNNNVFLLSKYYLPGNSAPYDDFYKWNTEGVNMHPLYSEQGWNVVHMNLDSPYVQEYIIKFMERWMEVYDIDGYRYDSGQESIERAPDFVTTLLKRLKNIKPDCWILIEGDDRDHTDFSFYDYGDAGYNWKLNSEWGDGGQGLPGVYKGMETLDELDDLLNWGITTAAPKKGLLCSYANVDYHDYFHNRYGWEQERAALALVFNTYGMPWVHHGEEVGMDEKGVRVDLSDPKGNIPYYARLIKARKYMLGNYPEVSRLSLSNSNDIYAFTAWRDTSMTLTVINFTDQAQTASVSLSDLAFQGKESKFWSEITDLETTTFSGESSTSIVLEAFEPKVFLLNTPLDQVFPALKAIELQSMNGESSISKDGGFLQLEVIADPENTIDEIEWILEGDSHLATIQNGLLQSCGCGDGTVTVIARSKANPDISDRMEITISTQSYGQILNPTFDYDITEWVLWYNEVCNANFAWDQGEAHVTVEPHEGGDFGMTMGSANYLSLKQGVEYRISFDARCPSEKKMYTKIWKSVNPWASFHWDEFQLTSSMQTYSSVFTMSEPDSEFGQLLFDFEGNGDEFWIDNISLCELVKGEAVKITFRVDLANETVSSEGVFMVGDWDAASAWTNPVQMAADGSIYSTTLDLEQGALVEFKFKNGSEWELPAGACVNSSTGNRIYTVPEADTEVSVVCFNSCEACGSSNGLQPESLASLLVYPNPTSGIIILEGLPDEALLIAVYGINGRRVSQHSIEGESVLELDLSTYPSGIYAISVQCPDRSESVNYRVVKE